MKWQDHLPEELTLRISCIGQFSKRVAINHWSIFNFQKKVRGRPESKWVGKQDPLLNFQKEWPQIMGSLLVLIWYSLESCHIINPDRPNCGIMCLRSPHVTSSRGVPPSINGGEAPATGSKKKVQDTHTHTPLTSSFNLAKSRES